MQSVGKRRICKAKDRRLTFDDVVTDLNEAVLSSNTSPTVVAADLNRPLAFDDAGTDLNEDVQSRNVSLMT